MMEVEKSAKETRAKAECSRSQLRKAAKAPWVNERRRDDESATQKQPVPTYLLESLPCTCLA
jgi:hypothetical protein